MSHKRCITYMVYVLIAFAAVGGTFLMPYGLQSDFNSPAGIVEEVAMVRETVVHIGTHSGQGSGCVVGKNGIVITAKHVVENCTADQITVTMDDHTKYKVKYFVEDRENDLAFLQLDLLRGTLLKAAKFAPTDPQIGEVLFLMGSPHGIGQFNSVSVGILSAKGRDLGGRWQWSCMLQSTVPAFPGNSGGPVFNMKGQIVGIFVCFIRETLNFNVPVLQFRGELDTVRTSLRGQRFVSPEKEETATLFPMGREKYK